MWYCGVNSVYNRTVASKWKLRLCPNGNRKLGENISDRSPAYFNLFFFFFNFCVQTATFGDCKNEINQ